MVIKFCMIFTQRGFNNKTLCKTKLTNFRLTTRAIFIMGKKFCKRFRNADRYLIIHVGKAKNKPLRNLSQRSVSTSGHLNCETLQCDITQRRKCKIDGRYCGGRNLWGDFPTSTAARIIFSFFFRQNKLINIHTSFFCSLNSHTVLVLELRFPICVLLPT